MKKIVFIHVPTCGTCKIAESMLDIVMESFPKLTLEKLNVASRKDFVDNYEISNIPCFLHFHDGVLVDKYYAFHSATYLFEKIKVFSEGLV